MMTNSTVSLHKEIFQNVYWIIKKYHGWVSIDDITSHLVARFGDPKNLWSIEYKKLRAIAYDVLCPTILDQKTGLTYKQYADLTLFKIA